MCSCSRGSTCAVPGNRYRILPSAMPLRDILHKRDELSTSKASNQDAIPKLFPPPADVTFMRSDTFSQEVITPPATTAPNNHPHPSSESDRPPSSSSRRSFGLFHRSHRSPSQSDPSPPHSRSEHRLSHLLHRDQNRTRSNSSSTSVNIPADLPQIVDEQGIDKQDREAQWEKRATVLVQQNPNFGRSGSAPRLSHQSDAEDDGSLQVQQSRSRSSSVGLPRDDVGAFT